MTWWFDTMDMVDNITTKRIGQKGFSEFVVDVHEKKQVNLFIMRQITQLSVMSILWGKKKNQKTLQSLYWFIRLEYQQSVCNIVWENGNRTITSETSWCSSGCNARVKYQLEKSIYIVGLVGCFFWFWVFVADMSPQTTIVWETIKLIDGDATGSSI